MSVTPPPEISQPNPPDPHAARGIHPLVALSLAVSIATAVGLLAGWVAAAPILLEILRLFAVYYRKRNQ